MNPLDSHNSGNYLFGGSFLKHFYSIYDYDQELISLGINTHSEGLVDMYPVDKMKVSEGGAKVKLAVKKEGEVDRTNEKPENTDHTNAYADAASTEKLSGKAPVEGIPQISANGETTIENKDSAGNKETEKHEVKTEKKENGEIAKTEVMPEAPRKEKEDRKKEIA